MKELLPKSMKYLILIIGLTLFLLPNTGIAQCFDREDFLVEVIEVQSGTDQIQLSLPQSTLDWIVKAYKAHHGEWTDVHTSQSGNQITLSNLSEGEYYLGLFSTDGCKYMLTRRDNVFEDFIIKSR